MDKDHKCLFRADGISKTFGTVHALEKFSITVAPGEIRGLVGENGSGKSTFSSIIAGLQKADADSGKMYLNEEEYNPSGTVDAVNKGISMVVQEQGTVSGISVAANIFFGREKQFARMGVLNVRKMNEKASEALHSIDVDWIRPEQLIDELTFEDRKLVELARALYTEPKIWIIDETTTALTVNGRELLYRLMNRVKEKGNSILFISHDIDEIMEKCDTLTVLRDGLLTANLKKAEFEADKIRSLMIGREVKGHYYREDTAVQISHQIVLEAKDVYTGKLSGVSVQLHAGEILGVGGLSDCGMHELGRVMFGLEPPNAGCVLKNGNERVKNPKWAVENSIGYVSKNRDTESMMPICSIKDNICLPSLKDLTRYGAVSGTGQKELSEKWSKTMEVKADSVNVFCNTLSGGNKQKVVLAKWLGKGSDILILDCPTRGIDVGTKAAIYQLIESLKKQGKSILLISEELQELIGMSDRIILLKDGTITGEFYREDGLSEEKLIQKMI
ncbi:MAG: sugar ABC transporter ATP-binding protein [Lachnospiraceae bacterium]|uniref:sugar ABC transporter ATP-binding protein n=1 Tax=Parablautia sp. Marseille-Q6255 TaxID=3039593 RepID=UPI0024BD2612|nr:sugar ABC transporter ATP-binding protein [Parablautia sp. Marseille-Q6255]